MARQNPAYYIAPSSIGITPNANASANDLAVYVANGAKIKLFSKGIPELDFVDNTYQEWTFSGKNRRLADSTKPYTIYARLSKTDKTDGYLVFAPKTLRDGVWIDKYSSVTINGMSVLYQDNGFDVRVEDQSYWYVRMGDVSLPDNNKRVITFDTGILGTDQFNVEWNLDPDDMPLRIELECKSSGKEMGTTPYVYWDESLQLSAHLIKGWDTDSDAMVERWTIMRNTGNTAADAAWNFPESPIVIDDDSSYDEDESEARQMINGLINLSHERYNDDFDGAVAAAFTVTAWGHNEETPDLVPLATVTITILAEISERYELVPLTGIMRYDPRNDVYDPEEGVKIHVRATDQAGNVYGLTNEQLNSKGISAEYAATGEREWTALTFGGEPADVAEAVIPASAFAAQQSINVRLISTLSSDSSDSSGTEEMVVELHRVTIAFVRDGEDSREREWIFLRSSSVIDFEDEEYEHLNPALINIGEVDPTEAAEGVTANKNQDGWVPQGWWNRQLGVDESNQYEYGAYRDFVHEDQASSDSSSSEGDTDRNGHWGDFSFPIIWSHFGENAYAVQANPPIVSFNCDSSGKSTDNSTKEVSLSMYKGADSVEFQAAVTRALHCMAWITGTTLHVSTGTAWQHSSIVLYTAKTNPSAGDLAYDFDNNAEYTITNVGSNSIEVQINSSSVSLTRLDNVSYHDLSQGGNVIVTLTVGDVSRILIIPVTGNKQGDVGQPGSAGPMLYPAGQWEAKTYTANGDSRPYVLFEPDGKYYYLSADSASSSDIPGPGSSVWTEMTQVDVVFAKFGIMDYGKMASAVFCGDWMYSQYGKLYNDETTYTNVNDDTTCNTPVTFNGRSAVPFAWFDPNYPQGGATAKFAPNWAVNLKTGVMYVSSGRTMQDVMNDIDRIGTNVSQLDNDLDNLQDEVGSLTTGNENLLRNSGFTGDYIDEEVSANTGVNPNTPMYSDPLAHWDAIGAEVITSVQSVTGKAVLLSNGSLMQTLEEPLSEGKSYIFSFRGFGSSVKFSAGGYTSTIALNNTNQRYNVKFTATESNWSFAITETTATLMELQLVEGKVPNTDWINSPKDNDKTLAYYQNLAYLANAIVNATTKVMGGLVLSQLFKVGNYRNGQMTQETGGMSGLYNSPNSPFLWGGGDMEKAFYTIAKYAEDPNYEATADEVKNLMAQFVVTHGGRAILNDVIVRGYVHAQGGYFRNGIFRNITSPGGKFRIDENGNMSVHDATISGDMYAPMFSITQENFDQYTRSGVRRILDLSLTGLNVKFENNFSTQVSIDLPVNESYVGAIARIFNNTRFPLQIGHVVDNTIDAWGTFYHPRLRDVISGIAPNSYNVFQCQTFPPYTIVENLLNGEDIQHTQNMQEIVSGLTVGSVVEIACGIIEGNGGYKITAGSTTLIDTTNMQSISDRMKGCVLNYKVVAGATTIYANVSDGSKAEINVYAKNSTTEILWAKVSESPDQGALPLGNMMVFEGTNGRSVGYDPYINADGFLRFGTWTRPDYDDRGIHIKG